MIHRFVSLPPSRFRLPPAVASLAAAAALLLSPVARAADAAPAPAAEAAPVETLHPALFLVGDSITKTGTPPGDRGPWGMGYEIIPLFDPAKIHVYNEGAGGRSSRSYIEEGLWGKILARIAPGDFVLVMFGHNDEANSMNYPDRATIKAAGDETIQTGFGNARKVIHTYGWYLQQYVKDAKARGATLILCSPVPRNQWIDDKIKRGFDGYAAWAAEAAKASGAPFLDLNALSADRFDAMGREKTRAYFNDPQHTTKAGAKVNAGSVVAGLRQLQDCPLSADLLPAAP